MEVDALTEAGIEEADVFIASTDGDNTNLTSPRSPRSSSRSTRSSSASWTRRAPPGTREQGLHTICPTQHAIEMFKSALSEIA